MKSKIKQGACTVITPETKQMTLAFVQEEAIKVETQVAPRPKQEEPPYVFYVPPDCR